MEFFKNPYPNTLNGSLWTLSIEFKWYVILAIFGLLKFLDKKTILTIILLSVFSWVYINYFTYDQKDYKSFLFRKFFFLIGVFLFLIKINF